MPVILYGTPASPLYRAVLLTARALGLVLEERFTDLVHEAAAGEEDVAGWVGELRVPRFNMPTLDDDGVIINKSNHILTHLVEKYGKSDSLYPRNFDNLRFEVDTMLHFNYYYFYNCIEEYFEPALFGKAVHFFKKVHIAKWLTDFETTLEGLSFAAAERLTIADFSLLCTISVMKSLALDLTGFPNICEYERRIKAEIPFYDEVTREGIKMLDDKLAPVFKK